MPAESFPPSISVAIATYKGAAHLQEQLESIAAQSCLPIEVVITDDQSPDDTLAVAENFAKTAPFEVRTSRNEQRLRYGDNFLRAASLCRGDLIAFCDQDDIWLPKKLEACAAYFKDPDVQLVCHSAQTFTGKRELGYRFPDIKRTQILRQGACNPLENKPGFVMVFRRNLLSLLPYENRPKRLYGHDHWAWFLAAAVGKLVKSSESLCLYRQHENNVYGAHRFSVGRKMQLAAEIPGYLAIATAERECSELLQCSVEAFPAKWQPAVLRSARKLARRSELHRLRSELYGADSTGLLTRLRLFGTLMRLGAYLPDRSKSRLGPKAVVKDLVFGVAGWRRVTAQK